MGVVISGALFIFICACFGVLHLVERTWGLYHPPTRYTATSLAVAKIRVYDDAEVAAYARARRERLGLDPNGVGRPAPPRNRHERRAREAATRRSKP